MSQAVMKSKQRAIRKDNPVIALIGKILLYAVLIFVGVFTLAQFSMEDRYANN